MSDSQVFALRLLEWFDVHGRHDLPWQIKDDPYKVWVSEIMLQQTQVKTVLNYYDRFITRFPTVQSLAAATWDEVAPYWAGLGYYARARNLHKAAQQVVELGDFPQDLAGWMQLSGVGRSTGGALMSLGLGKFGVILDGNVKRVLSRYFAIEGDLSKPVHERPLWQLAESLVPQDRHASYTQAIMDLGATICTPKKPLCLYCPMQQDCQAYAQDRVLDFPEKKAKKAVPTRQAHVLMITCQDQSLWIKRPTEGLWGGLYCLPMCGGEESYQTWLETWQLNAIQQAQVQHQFTHFTWQLSCHHYDVDSAIFKQLQQHFNAQIFTMTQLSDLAMPTAMHKVLSQLKSAQ